MPGEQLPCQVNIAGPETFPIIIAENDSASGSTDEPCWFSPGINEFSLYCTRDLQINLSGNQFMLNVTVLPGATGKILFYWASGGSYQALPNATNATITIGQ